MVIVPDWILLGFIHNPDTLALARLPMRLVGVSLVFEAAGLVLMSALLGAGDARRVMVVSVTTQWLVFLPLAYLVGPLLGFGLLGIWALQGLYRVAQAFIYVGFWRGGHWATIKV
jgi:MATE family multidrug resistance protein